MGMTQGEGGRNDPNIKKKKCVWLHRLDVKTERKNVEWLQVSDFGNSGIHWDGAYSREAYCGWEMISHCAHLPPLKTTVINTCFL
jgi:hypothetical protein